MTEEQWLAATDVVALRQPGTRSHRLARRAPGKLVHSCLNYLRQVGTERKRRLFAAACVRRTWHLLADPRSRSAVEIAEQYADRHLVESALTSAEELSTAAFAEANKSAQASNADSGKARAACFSAQAARACTLAATTRWDFVALAAIAVRNALDVECTATANVNTPKWSEEHNQLLLVHDIFGNPFRPVAFDPAWRSSDVMLLATGIYNERAFDQLPILADALQDAGCDSEDLLSHLRDPSATHVRGCWALNLVLGKE